MQNNGFLSSLHSGVVPLSCELLGPDQSTRESIKQGAGTEGGSNNLVHTGLEAGLLCTPQSTQQNLTGNIDPARCRKGAATFGKLPKSWDVILAADCLAPEP